MNSYRLGLVTGCFDLLHPGHIKFLRFAASKVDKLIVGIESDRYLRLHKGKNRPIFSARNRRLIISELKSVASVFIISPHPDYQKLLKNLKIDCLIVSKKDNLYKEKHQICRQQNIAFIRSPTLSDFSTSTILKKIK